MFCRPGVSAACAVLLAGDPAPAWADQAEAGPQAATAEAAVSAAEPADEQPDEELLQGRPPHHWRSLQQMGIGLGVGALIYWTGMERNSPDWDNPRLSQRFDGTAWRLDNNSLPVNFILHPLVGAGAYAFARANHHGVAMSAGYSFAASFLWEFVFEFKEMVSINDVLVTPAAGIPLGEFLHKLGIYLGSAERPGTAVQAAQWSLGTGVQLDRALDGVDAPPVRERDQLGLTSDIWHEFEFDSTLHLAHGHRPGEYLLGGAGLRGRLVSLPGYLRPGSMGRFFRNADISSLGLRTELSRHGAGVELVSDTLLCGYHAQEIRGVHAPAHGYAATLGASIAFRFLESEAHNLAEELGAVYTPEPSIEFNKHKFNEQLSVAHLPGPGVDWQVLARGVRLEASLRAHPDFAGVGALAFSDWAEAYPDERGKAILLKQGYFYGWGASSELSARLSLGPLRLQGGVFYGRYWSQEGFERQPQKLTVDVPAEAMVLFYRGGLALQPPELPVAVGFGAAARRWDTSVGGFRRTARVMSRGLDVSVWF
jgi:hypothetical protein